MITIGIGEYSISNDKDEILTTHGLGSCVALIFYCTKTKSTALAHIVLPESNIKGKIKSQGYFATEIVPKLTKYFIEELKCEKNQLEVHLIGGACSFAPNDVFQVGEKNVVKIKQLLHEYGIKPSFNDTGGGFSRTVSIRCSNGQVDIKRQKMIL